ncbi:MAG: hypothetical protein AAFQ15_06800 [Pseudomonadota bacterium]
MLRLALAACFGLALGPYSSAQDTGSATPAPPCSQEAYKQFDFWLGTWEVTTPDGAIAGVNDITSEEGGCLILETWTSATGGSGQSYNYYNPASEKWRQVWVSPGFIIDYEGGLTASGSMKLAGTITYMTSAFEAAFTGEWSLNEDGTVTQHFEQYDPEEEKWSTWFTGIYTKIESAQP